MNSGRLLCATWMVLLLGSVPVQSQEPASSQAKDVALPVSGTLKIGDKTYTLSNIAAYKAQREGTEVYVVVASDRLLPPADLKAFANAPDDKANRALRQPYLKLTIRPNGEMIDYRASAGGTSLGANGQGVVVDLKIDDGEIRGRISLEATGEGRFVRSFDAALAVPIGLDHVPVTLATGDPSKPSVTGSFLGDGQPAKLAHFSAVSGTPLDNRPTIRLIFSERDHARSTQPELDAHVGKLGNTLIVTMREDGTIIRCQVSHTSFEMTSLPAEPGGILIEDFKLQTGLVSGRLRSRGVQEFFHHTWETDLKFVIPFVPKPLTEMKEAPATSSTTKAKRPPRPPRKPRPSEPEEDPVDQDEAAGPPPNIYDLPLPKNAIEPDFQRFVKHVEFASPDKVEDVARQFADLLAEQNWKVVGSDQIAADGATLKRRKSGATLKIFMSTSTEGCLVTLFTDGFDWTRKPMPKPDSPIPPSTTP